jgi:hypothetical protein
MMSVNANYIVRGISISTETNFVMLSVDEQLGDSSVNHQLYRSTMPFDELLNQMKQEKGRPLLSEQAKGYESPLFTKVALYDE